MFMRSVFCSCGSVKSIWDAPVIGLRPSLWTSCDKGELLGDSRIFGARSCRPSLSCVASCRDLRLPFGSPACVSWWPCRCRGPLGKLESSKKPPDRRTRCFRRAKSSSCIESLASVLPDSKLLPPFVALVVGLESWLRRGEKLPSVYAPEFRDMYVCEEVVQRSESAEGRPSLDGADISLGCAFVTTNGQGVAWR
jgi:hypothetical protein